MSFEAPADDQRTVMIPPPEGDRVIDVTGLDFHYGKSQALFGVNLPVARGKITALIGPSGCGKSTLLRTLNRIYDLYPGQQASGTIRFDGENILDLGKNSEQLRARIGMVFQRPTPFPMSIYDNMWDEVKDKLHTSGLGLSGGQQQRLCVARGIAINPDVLLLDEPASALDPLSTAKLESTLIELKDTLTIVIVTHNLQQAARISDYTGFMLLGRMIEFRPSSDAFVSPETKPMQDYITGRFG